MTVVLLEFDQRQYPTALHCRKWLRQSPYAGLEDQKTFRLASTTKSTFISKEFLKVWQYKKDGWRYSHLECLRPDKSIYVQLADSNPIYTALDLPPLSDKCSKKEAALLLARNKRDEASEIRRQNLQLARRQKKSSSRVPAIVDTDPIEELLEKRKKSEEKRKRKKMESSSKSNKKSKKTKSQRVKKEMALLDSDNEDTDEEINNQLKEARPTSSLLKPSSAVLQEVDAPKDALKDD